MKTIITLATAALLLAGCASTPEQRLNEYALIAYDVGAIGGTAALAINPEYRTELTLVRDMLTDLLKEPQIHFSSIMVILKKLPIDAMNTSEAQVLIAAGRVTLKHVEYRVDVGEIDQQRLKVLIENLRDGLSDALQ